ncbi:MAG: HAMP domain-containing histidine kinase [Acidobacteria bacterium]|nr:HAMP domain-containing histidine kinase [Acidobacteriota bacterium]
MDTFLKNLDRKRKTIGFRLAAWYGLVFIVSSLAVFGLAYFLLSVALQQKDWEIIESQLKLYASRYESEGLEAIRGEIDAGHKESLFVRVAGPRNQTLLQHIPVEWNEFDFKQLEATRPRSDPQWTYLVAAEEELFEDPDRLEILSSTLPDGSLVQVGKSTEARKDILGYFQGIFAIVMVAVLGIGVAGGALLADRSLRPVRDLVAVLRSVRETGKLTARVPTRQTGDELDELAGLFNALLGTIESLVNRMRSALDTIAHDLRTPMTRLRGAAEMALRAQPDLQTYKQALADCLEEAEQTLTMLNTLMDVAEAEAGAMKLEVEEVNLAALIGSVVGLYEHVAEDKGITLHTALPERLCLQADAKRLRQAVANLLDNAIKYTPPGGRIEIEAHGEQHQALISVRDTGIGIKPEELPKIWDRLYRGEAGQSQRGLGLGLSLVRAVVLAHKGSVEAHSQPGQGSRFVVYLPVDSQP